MRLCQHFQFDGIRFIRKLADLNTLLPSRTQNDRSFPSNTFMTACPWGDLPAHWPPLTHCNNPLTSILHCSRNVKLKFLSATIWEQEEASYKHKINRSVAWRCHVGRKGREEQGEGGSVKAWYPWQWVVSTGDMPSPPTLPPFGEIRNLVLELSLHFLYDYKNCRFILRFHGSTMIKPWHFFCLHNYFSAHVWEGQGRTGNRSSPKQVPELALPCTTPTTHHSLMHLYTSKLHPDSHVRSSPLLLTGRQD